ncbi:MAG: rRNA maturation RNase YbeY [Trueperaceae bacterium]
MAYVEVLDETRRFGRAPELQDLLVRYMADDGLDDRELSVVIVDDDAIAERNGRDRGVDGATDVLSYPTMEPDDVDFPQVPHLGDVFVSLDTAVRQAQAQGHDAFLEVATLCVHGLTHLLGFDHRDEREWEPFRRAERRVLDLVRAQADRSGPAGPPSSEAA